MKRTAVIYLHTPKTGGMTFRFNMEAYLGNAFVAYRVDKSSYETPSIVTKNWTGAWNCFVADDSTRLRRAFSSTDRICIAGHFPFGIHTILDQKNLFSDPINYEYIGVVREPVERELSCLNYQAAKRDISPDDYILDFLNPIEPIIADNPQTRIFAGYSAMSAEHCTEEIFEQAKRNVSAHFSTVLTTERLDDGVPKLLAGYGFSTSVCDRVNVTPKRELDMFSDDVRQWLNGYHAFDQMLYNWVDQIQKSPQEACWPACV